MNIIIAKDKKELGAKAAQQGIELILEAIRAKGHANIIVATGASQFEMLDILVKSSIDWSVVTCFHLDEYVGLPETHPASFRKYLKDRFVDLVRPLKFHYVNGEAPVEEECLRLKMLINKSPIDVAFVGIGENAHLAFNDPPANFDTEEAYLEVHLDEDCRSQQYNEGWFKNIEDVPEKAISMSIRQIMKSQHIICSVPDQRKANAVQKVVEGVISNLVPASIMQNHKNVNLYLDIHSSSLLEKAKS